MLSACNFMIRRGFASAAPTTKLFIGGKFVESSTDQFVDVHDPATNQVVSRVPCATADEMKMAADAASDAFKTWSQTSVLTRQQLMFKLQQLIKENTKELAKLITLE